MNILVRFINWLADIRRVLAMRNFELEVNAKCPGCGHRNGKLRTGNVRLQGGAEKVMVEHQCQVCGAKFYEDTLADPSKWVGKRPTVAAPIRKIPPPINDEKPFTAGK